METRKLITILTPTFNEEDNVELLISKVEEQILKFPQYDFDHDFVDNASIDNTVEILRKISYTKKHERVIVNAKNFGHIRSHFHAFLDCKGDAVINLVADFQDPIELISEFILHWEKGKKLVLGIKKSSKESKIMFFIRSVFYNILSKVSDTENLLRNFTGFGLYDKTFLYVLRKLEDPYPYFRGLISEFGYDIYTIEYSQPKRRAGKTKNNFFTLYDMAMLGFTNHSKLPLRLAAFIGFFSAIISLFVAIGYFVYKLMYWNTFQAGTAPMVIGVFFFSSVQLFFIGIIGEYIGAIHTHVRKRPYVVERERINFR